MKYKVLSAIRTGAKAGPDKRSSAGRRCKPGEVVELDPAAAAQAVDAGALEPVELVEPEPKGKAKG